MKEDYYGVGIIPEDSLIGKLYFHEIEYEFTILISI